MKSLTQKAKKLLLKLPTMSRTGDRDDRQRQTEKEKAKMEHYLGGVIVS